MKEKQSKRKQQKEKQKKTDLKREHRVTFMLNDMEFNALEQYMRKYKITNRSKWYRTIIFTQVWKNFMEDYPTLFDENEMR